MDACIARHLLEKNGFIVPPHYGIQRTCASRSQTRRYETGSSIIQSRILERNESDFFEQRANKIRQAASIDSDTGGWTLIGDYEQSAVL